MSDREALKTANKSRDAALDKLANEDATTTGDDTLGSVETGRRDIATPLHARDLTGLDLADSVYFDLDESFEDGLVPNGGASADNSSYHLSHIKPRSRSRQSSIIGRNDPPIRPSSRSGTTPLVSSSFNIGAFRRRAREPSILGTGRTAQPDVTATTTQDQDSDSEVEFAPEAESTPLNRRRSARQSLQKGKEREAEEGGASASKKRKSDISAADDDVRPHKVLRSDGENSEQDSDSDSALSSLPSPRAMALNLERPVTPTNGYNENDMASPASSATDGQQEWPDIRNLGKRRRRPSVADPLLHEDLSDVSSPPSLTHSPNHNDEKASKARGRAKARRHQSPKLTTADLADLLPKRRYKRARSPVDGESDEELDAAGLGQDEDELSHLDATRRRGPSRSASRASRHAQAALKEKDTPAVNTRTATRNSRTYARRSSDKENREGGEEEDEDENEASRFVPLPEDSFTEETRDTSYLSTSNELKQAKAKFKEVDGWNLEFEEASEPPSPVGAR